MCVYGRGGGAYVQRGEYSPRHGIQRDRVGKRAVRVLLECLLVKNTCIYVTFVCLHVRVI